MSWGAEFTLFTGILVALLMGGMWIPFAIGVAGLAAIYFMDGWTGFRALGLVSWGSMNSFTLTAVPMFILMAEILQNSGVSHRFYNGLNLLVRRLPGGLLQTNIAGCALFAAISGSSVATAAAIGTVALPQLDKLKYDRKMAAGSLAAGGTLGILIPPSIPLIIYGTFTETSISKLFMAGFIPGFMLAGLFMLFIGIMAVLSPAMAPIDPARPTLAQRLRALIDLGPFFALMVAVLGSIYAGLATPTEASSIGCTFAIIISVLWGNLTLAGFYRAVVSTVRISCTILFIVLMAFIFAYGVENAGVGTAISKWIAGLGLEKYWFFAAVVIMYCVLGCLIDSIGMLVLTVPLLFPTIVAYGFDPIWFGIVLVLMLELGQVTPPFGINLFVIQGISGWPLSAVVNGTAPYWTMIIGFTVLLAVFPEIVLWLPDQMFVR